MVAAVVVLAVVALVVSIALAVVARSASSTRGELRDATTRVDELTATGEELSARAAGLDDELADARAALATCASERDALAARVREAEHAQTTLQRTRDQAAERAASSEASVAVLEARLGVVEGERDELATLRDGLAGELADAKARESSLRDELDEARAGARAGAERLAAVDDLGDGGGALARASALWALDARRLERLWRERVTVVPDDPSPLEGAEPVRAAVEVLAAASREETGVVVDTSWAVVGPVPGPAAVALVRVVEELVAAARDSDGGELVVGSTDGGYRLELRTEPATEPDPRLAEAVGVCGGSMAVDGPALVVTLPAA